MLVLSGFLSAFLCNSTDDNRAWAAPSESQTFFDLSDFGGGEALAQYTDLLAARNQRSWKNISAWSKEAPEEARACRASYEKIFADGVMKFTLAFGYHDANSRTLDGDHYRSTLDTLTRSCPSTRSAACGFRIVAGSASGHWALLSKNVEIPQSGNQSGKWLNARIDIKVAHPSVSAVDSANLSSEGAATARQSSVTRMIEDLFFGGLRGLKADGSPQEKCEICTYYGHARDGGGPDFSPVPYAWRTEEGEPNYSIYLARRTGYRRLLAGLAARRADPPQLIAVLACSSHSHFWSKKTCVEAKSGCTGSSLSDYASSTGFILSRDLSWPQNFDKTLGVVLDTTLGFKCRSAAERNLGQLKNLPGKTEKYGLFGNFL